MNLSTATPVEIDTVLAENYRKQSDHASKVAQLQGALLNAKATDAKIARGERGYMAYMAVDEKTRQGWRDEIVVQQAILDTLALDAAPYEDEFASRPWTRAFKVTNSNGHVHSSRRCTTCFASTDFHWDTTLSGSDEAEIVDAAGEDACTVCYPTAPTLPSFNNPSRIFTPAEKEARAARETRERARAAKAAAAVLDPDTGKVLFKTERGATNQIASQLGSMVHYGPTHPSFGEWQREVSDIIAALKARGVEVDYDAALEKARKKVRAEHNAFKKDSRYQQWLAQGLIDEATLVEGYDPAKF